MNDTIRSLAVPCLLATAIGGHLTAQADLYVDQAVAIGTNDGLSWSTAFPTLDQALNAANLGDEIWVATGRYIPRQRTVPSDPRSATYVVRRAVTVIGGFAGNETSFSQWPALPCLLSGEIGNFNSNADNLYHVVTAQNDINGSSMRGFTIAFGNAVGAAEPRGGGIRAFNNSIMQVRDCYFLRNVATDGGAICIDQVGGMSLQQCVFDDNDALDDGGAIHAIGGGAELRMANCAFLGNGAGKRGGALSYRRSRQALVNGFPSVNNCVFARNVARGKGGAVFIGKGTQLGGGASVPGSGAYFFNCSFHANTSLVEGGAIYANTAATVPAVVEVYNSILWANAAPIGAQYGGGGPATFSNIDGGYPGLGNINSDPLFVDPLNDDLRLMAASPSIDTGSNGLLPPDWFDLDGDGLFGEPLSLDFDLLPRVQGISVDMGAFEQGDM